MTITFQQMGQLNNVGGFVWDTADATGVAVVFNPTLPALLFSYNPNGNNYITFDAIEVVVGTSTQTTVYGYWFCTTCNKTTPLMASYTPTIWFANVIISGGSVCNENTYPSGGGTNCQSLYLSFNQTSQTFNWTHAIEPNASDIAGFQDLAIDYVNQVAYLYYITTTPSQAIMYSIPYAGLVLITNDNTFPSSYQVAWFTVSSPPSGFNLYYSTMVYYNSTFYFSTIDGSGNFYIWVVALSSITFGSSLPSSAQTIGTLYEIYNNGGCLPGSYGAAGNIFLNYYTSSGSVVYEILAYVPVSYDSSLYAYSGFYIYSFDISTNSATLLYNSISTYVKGRSINMGGLVTFVVVLGNNSFAIGIYDRIQNVYQQSSTFSSLYDLKVAQPYYAVAFADIPNGNTLTVYEILVDTSPIITNLQVTSGTLSGTVVNANGNVPMSGVTVYLYQLSSQGDGYVTGTQVASTTTNANGQFSFTLSSAGYYAVQVIQ